MATLNTVRPKHSVTVKRAMNFEKFYCTSQEYGDRLSRILKYRNMTISKLAEKINVRHSTISKIKTGFSKKINISRLNEICNVLGCSYLYLLGKSNPEAYEAADETKIFFNPQYNCVFVNYMAALFCDSFYLENKITNSGKDYPNILYYWKEFLSEITNNEVMSIFDNDKHFILTHMTVADFIKKEYSTGSDTSIIADRAHDYIINGKESDNLSRPDVSDIIIDYIDDIPNSIYTVNDLLSDLQAPLDYGGYVEDILIIQEYSKKSNMITCVNTETIPASNYVTKLDKIFQSTLNPQRQALIDFLYDLTTISELSENEIIKLLQYMHYERSTEARQVYRIIKELVTKSMNADMYKSILRHIQRLT